MRRLGHTFLLRLPAVIFILLLLTTFAAAQAGVPENNAELPRFHRVSERLFRGGQPRPGSLRRLAELGINTIVNLRGESHRTRSDAEEALSLGLNYFNVPMPAWGRPEDVRVQRILEIITAPGSGVVFVHCKNGVDRTGTVVALFRISREGWASRAALAEADRRGMRKVQYWMRDYVKDYGRRLRRQGAEATAQHQRSDADLGDRIGDGVRIAESKTFRARKLGARFLRRVPGAISDFLGGIF
jgi:protein tyrosine phosphatase (PTP) superfamily phosphohydrolase (DUF442 family)